MFHIRPSRWTAPAVAAAALTFALPAVAQMPPNIAEKVKAIGRVVDPPKTAAIYAPLHPKEPYQGVKVVRDVKYGPDARNLLDVFTPENATGPAPVFIFIHGGAFVGGNKRTGDSPFYDNFALFAAKNGMIGVNATYRLAPANPWPAAPHDIAAVVKWIRANIASHGGDPQRVFINGHSAGASIVAGYLADRKLWPSESDSGIKGVMMMAGVYDFTLYEAGKPEIAYLGEDRSKYEARSPLRGVVASNLPMMVAHAELDPPAQVQQSGILYANLCNKNRCPKRVILPKHSHMSTVYAVNTDDTQLADAMLEFMKSVK
jgi:triacylglycerol lipase